LVSLVTLDFLLFLFDKISSNIFPFKFFWLNKDIFFSLPNFKKILNIILFYIYYLYYKFSTW
jgi:hypothetical protein